MVPIKEVWVKELLVCFIAGLAFFITLGSFFQQLNANQTNSTPTQRFAVFSYANMPTLPPGQPLVYPNPNMPGVGQLPPYAQHHGLSSGAIFSLLMTWASAIFFTMFVKSLADRLRSRLK